MSRSSDYKNLKDLTKSLSKGIDKLESGNLNSTELTSLLEDSRTLHERITVLQYLAFEKEVKIKEPKKPKKEPKIQQGNFELNFGTPEIIDEQEPVETDATNEEVHPNQINLLDAIEEHVEENIEPEPEPETSPVDEVSNEDAPTSINDSFASGTPKKTLADKLGRQPITDLKAAIGLNQKFLYMNDLFQGENEIFHDAIDKINAFRELAQAIEYIESNLSSSYKWDMESSSVLSFMDLVERRFMA